MTNLHRSFGVISGNVAVLILHGAVWLISLVIEVKVLLVANMYASACWFIDRRGI